MVSSRQFYIIFAISTISMKMQKLPCLIAASVGKDAWLIYFPYALINVIGLVLAFFIIKQFRSKNVKTYQNKTKNNIFGLILNLLIAFYFFMQALLFYEHIQALFANTLFDNLSWAFFGTLLLFCVFFLSHSGLKNIARNFDLFVWLIILPLFLIAALGIGFVDFSAILPLETANFNKILANLRLFDCWFGDFFFALFLGMHCKDAKLSKTILVYLGGIVFLSFMTIELVGICGTYAAIEPGLISVLSEPSMLGLNLGRLDWFLILFAEIGAIFSCSVCLFFSTSSAKQVFDKINPNLIEFFTAIIFYYFDVFFFVDVNAKKNFFCGVMGYLSPVIVIFVLVCFLIEIWFCKIYHKNNQKLLKNGAKT